MVSKHLFIAILALITISLNAQSLQLGYVQPTSIATVGSTSTQYTTNGFQGGITNSTELQNSLSLNYGILYSYLKGTKTILGTDAINNVHNIDIPLRLSLKLPVALFGVEPFVYGGPNLTYTLSNTTKYTLLGNEITSDLYDDEDYSRINIQLGMGVGLKYKTFTLKAGYDWGMLDLNKSDNLVLNTNALIISLGFEL